MGLPWDEASVPRNLKVIASLRSGDKLSVLKKGTHPTNYSNLGKGGRGLREIFDRQQGGFWAGKRGLERSKKGETLLEDKQYFIPLVSIFQAAVRMWHEGQGVQPLDIANAYRGLERMKSTYRKSSLQHRQKMHQILTTINPMIPRVGASRCIPIKKGRTVNLLKQKELAGMENFFAGFLNSPDNAGFSQEQEGTAGQLRSIFGTDQQSQASPTRIPTNGGMQYTRQKLGVCRQFIMDNHRNPGWLGKNRLPPDGVASTKTLYQALSEDEAMLFLVSQLVNQAGIEALISDVLTYRAPDTKQYEKYDWLFSASNLKILPIAWQNHPIYITLHKHWLEVTSIMKIDCQSPAAFQACELAKDPSENTTPIQPFSGLQLGLPKFEATFALSCRRNGQTISWQLNTAEVQT